MNTLKEACMYVGGTWPCSFSLLVKRIYEEKDRNGTVPMRNSLRELIKELFLPARYSIAIQTGDVAYAGTDANVLITLYGLWGKDLPERDLDTPANDFEKKSISKFLLDGQLIGEISKVRIRHNNTGDAPDWYLEQIIVQRIGSKNKYWFNCHRWLSRSKEDCAIDLILQEHTAPIPTPGVKINCEETQSSKPKPPNFQKTFLKSCLIFNCNTDHREIIIWLLDLTANSGWKNVGTLQPQYNNSGYCPQGEPIVINFEDKHQYSIYFIDIGLYGCSNNYANGTNFGYNLACVRATLDVTGAANGLIEPVILH